MPRIDKYEPLTGGTRAPLAAAWSAGDIGVVIGVGLNASGQVVKGAGNSGVIGVVCLQKAYPAGTIVDVMQDGDMVEMTGLTAGTAYYINTTTGALQTAAPGAGVNGVSAGFTVEATRLVVRVQSVQG